MCVSCSMDARRSFIAPTPRRKRASTWCPGEGLVGKRGSEAVKYKGYTAVLKADEEQGILFGRVLGLLT